MKTNEALRIASGRDLTIEVTPRGEAVLKGGNELIQAPATCHECRITMVSPTTGLVGSKCFKCGGDLMSDPRPEPLPTLADGPVTREEVMESLMELYELAVEGQRVKDPTFVRWPDMVRILDHINQHGLPPKEV